MIALNDKLLMRVSERFSAEITVITNNLDILRSETVGGYGFNYAPDDNEAMGAFTGLIPPQYSSL